MFKARYRLTKNGKFVGYDTYNHRSYEHAKRDEEYSNKIKRDGYTYELINKPRQMTPRKAPQQMGFNFSSKGNLPRLLR